LEPYSFGMIAHAPYYSSAFCAGTTQTPVSRCTQIFSEHERSLYAVARSSVVCLSSVCNARAPHSGGCNFRQYFYGIRYLGHPLVSTENFTEIVPGEPLHRGS